MGYPSNGVVFSSKKVLFLRSFLLILFVAFSCTTSHGLSNNPAFAVHPLRTLPPTIIRKSLLPHISTTIAISTKGFNPNFNSIDDISIKRITSSSLFSAAIEKNSNQRNHIESVKSEGRTVIKHESLEAIRSNTSTGYLTQEQEAFILSLNPDIYGSPFLVKLGDLLKFKNIHGSCSVPKRYKQNPSLGELLVS